MHNFSGCLVNSWCRVTHICVNKLTIIGSDYGLSPDRHQAIIWTNAGILLIGPSGTNFSEILIEILTLSLKKNAFESVVCETAAILSRPQCIKPALTLWHGWVISSHTHVKMLLLLHVPCATKPSARQTAPHVSECHGIHDDVIKWKHFPRYWPFVRGIHRSSMNFPHKGQWRGALMFSLIYAWINGWVNNREAGDLRHHHGHYDATVM